MSLLNLPRKAARKIKSKIRDKYNLQQGRYRRFVIEDTLTYSNQIKYIRGTNNIIYYNDGNNSGYFRESRLHEDKRSYIHNVVKEYFSLIVHSEHALEFEAAIMEKLKEKKNINKFFKMGFNWGGLKYSNRTPIAKYLTTHDASVIGINGVLPEWFSEMLPDFVLYARWPVFDYGYNQKLLPYQYHLYFTSKMKASKIIADILGVPQIIPDTKYICLKINDTVKIGISVNPASGFDPTKMNITYITPNFQRDLTIMAVLDVVCYYHDHRPGNYFCIPDSSGNISGICVLDNDEPGAFTPSFSVRFSSYNNEAPLVTKKGFINRPYLDHDTIARLMETKDKDIAQALNAYLTNIELYALLIRVRRLRRAVLKSLQAGKIRLLHKNEWTLETMREELSGTYGTTHLKFFADKFNAKITQ